MTKKEKPHYLGHRKRIKEKFLKSNSDSFQDYELLEILLFSTHPRKDTKVLSKKIIDKFDNIHELINSDLNLLKDDLDINENILVLLKIIKEIINRNFLQQISDKIIINNWDLLLNYCKARFLNLKNEEFRILFLNKKHELIEDYKHNEGLSDKVRIDIEKISRKAILLSTYSVILTHNHPTGDVKPSQNDIITTDKIAKSLKTINIKTHDHLIIGNNGEYYSFKENGLL